MTTAMSDAQPQGAPSSAQPGAGAGDTQPSSGVAPSAPAPWSESQQAAHAEMQALRGSLIKPNGTTDLAARSRYNELSAHVYSNGPLPQHMRPAPSAQDLQAPATDSAGFTAAEREALVAPAESPSDYKLRGGTLPGGTVEPETLEYMQGLLHNMKLPGEVGSLVLDRLAAHRTAALDTSGGENASTFVSQADISEFVQVADETLRGMGLHGFEHANALARAYVESVLSPAQLKEFDEFLSGPNGAMSSLAFDPAVIAKLAMLAQVRGLQPKATR